MKFTDCHMDEVRNLFKNHSCKICTSSVMVNGSGGSPKEHARILLHKMVENGTAELKVVGKQKLSRPLRVRAEATENPCFLCSFRSQFPCQVMLCSGQDLRVKVSKSPFCVTFYFQAAVKGCNLEQGVLDMVQITFC